MNIVLHEHQSIAYQEFSRTGIKINDFPARPDKSVYLGLTSDLRQQTVKASYYIGLSWLKEGECSVSVLPKINVDYLKMFMDCFYSDDNDVQDKLMQIYSIDFDKPCIHLENTPFEFTPFIIIHFLQLMKKLIKKGLKKGYILKEENLKGKVKGKILFAHQYKKNLSTGRIENNYCRYQEYSEDCIENRILKKTLLFVAHFLNNYELSDSYELQRIVQSMLPIFQSVSDISDTQEIRKFQVNPFYREYARALKVAKLILRRFSYDIQSAQGDADKTLPPFWIDMPLLYELYILNMLRNRFGSKIYYHIATRKDEIDFGKRDEHLIMDAKYVPDWDTEVNTEHIGQLARYARAPGIRRKLLGTDDDTIICNCLLLYPSIQGITSFEKENILKEGNVKEMEYLQFFKLGIKLPISQNRSL
ncbi:5-methylcytosine restriction system specificity protein McrC [Mediterranea massiliensis]|uniref:5-methylcytosine restriction system specificity protein McrC n=1 Tax=Mediterranea massiliensis TaxID=1841865 RepID=UPI0009335ECD|nr:hypothetical protein [Mediterranea massiliensis]